MLAGGALCHRSQRDGEPDTAGVLVTRGALGHPARPPLPGLHRGGGAGCCRGNLCGNPQGLHEADTRCAGRLQAGANSLQTVHYGPVPEYRLAPGPGCPLGPPEGLGHHLYDISAGFSHLGHRHETCRQQCPDNPRNKAVNRPVGDAERPEHSRAAVAAKPGQLAESADGRDLRTGQLREGAAAKLAGEQFRLFQTACVVSGERCGDRATVLTEKDHGLGHACDIDPKRPVPQARSRVPPS